MVRIIWFRVSNLLCSEIIWLFSPMIMKFQFDLLKNTSSPDYNQNLSPLDHARLAQPPRNFILIGIVTVHLVSLICIAIIVKVPTTGHTDNFSPISYWQYMRHIILQFCVIRYFAFCIGTSRQLWSIGIVLATGIPFKASSGKPWNVLDPVITLTMGSWAILLQQYDGFWISYYCMSVNLN